MPFDEKATALIPSVGADGGQPISINTNQSIADAPVEINENFMFPRFEKGNGRCNRSFRRPRSRGHRAPKNI